MRSNTEDLGYLKVSVFASKKIPLGGGNRKLENNDGKNQLQHSVDIVNNES